MAHANWRSFHQPDVAIDASSRIPARRVRRIVQTDRDHIVCSRLDVRCKVQLERGIAIRPAANKTSVEPNGRIRHGAIDVEIKLFTFVLRRDREMFSIPPNTPPG